MFVGRVIGHVWSTVKWDALGGLRLLLVRPHRLEDLRRLAGDAAAPVAAQNEAVVVADLLGAGPGEDVVVAYGHAARAGLEELQPGGAPPKHPVDAAVVAIVDRYAVTAGNAADGGGVLEGPAQSSVTGAGASATRR